MRLFREAAIIVHSSATMLSLLCVAALAITVSGSSVPAAARVAGGSETTVNQYPFVASLAFTSFVYTQQHIGTATIINNRSALTLATWVYDMNTAYIWHLRIGASYYNSGGQVYDVNSVIYHPNWNYEPLTSDITLMRVSTAFAFGANVQPAPIAGPSYILPEGTAVTTLGWGRTYSGHENPGHLHELQIEIVNQEICESTSNSEGIEIASDMMCAGVLGETKGLCTWDFGGPLLHNGVVIGVASFWQPCGTSPGLYTRVANASDWIVANA